MVTRRSAESEESRRRADVMNPALALQALGPCACRHGTCFASQPVVTCTPSYLLSCMGVASCPSGGQGQTVVPVFGWANQGLKGHSPRSRNPGNTHGDVCPCNACQRFICACPLNATGSSPPLESQGPLDQSTRKSRHNYLGLG